MAAPPCIIDWSGRVAQAAEDLALAVIITVVCDGPLVDAADVATVIAPVVRAEAETLVLRRWWTLWLIHDNLSGHRRSACRANDGPALPEPQVEYCHI